MKTPRVRFDDLGDWGRVALLSEYDPATGTIAINVRVMRRLQATHGARFAARFATCAILHELHHHKAPGASEASAHAFARAACGDDPRIFEAALRDGSA
jgi:hypothetical protein